MENQIMAEHLSFHYTDEEGKVVSPEILKDLSLTFQPGSFVASERGRKERRAYA